MIMFWHKGWEEEKFEGRWRIERKGEKGKKKKGTPQASKTMDSAFDGSLFSAAVDRKKWDGVEEKERKSYDDCQTGN